MTKDKSSSGYETSFHLVPLLNDDRLVAYQQRFRAISRTSATIASWRAISVSFAGRRNPPRALPFLFSSRRTTYSKNTNKIQEREITSETPIQLITLSSTNFFGKLQIIMKRSTGSMEESGDRESSNYHKKQICVSNTNVVAALMSPATDPTALRCIDIGR